MTSTHFCKYGSEKRQKSTRRVIQKYFFVQYLKLLKNECENMSEDLVTHSQNFFPVSNNLLFREFMSFYLTVLEIWTLRIYFFHAFQEE